MKVIGRKDAIRELESCEKSGKSEFVCLYGRRRVGKTCLVEQTFANYFAFRPTGVEGGSTRVQLKSFHQRLLESEDTTRKAPKNWFEAFSRLEQVLASDGITNICEEKYTDTSFAITAEYEAKLLNKMELFREKTKAKNALKLVMICADGIAGSAHTEHVSRVLTLDDLFGRGSQPPT